MSQTTDDAARARLLRSAMPKGVYRVCKELAAAGYEAFAVGGAIRDVLLGRPAGDWDVATSATPEQVQACFRKVLPTGIEHGTVTVLMRERGEREAIEVTTFRGEGDYSDGRHPDQVRFGVPLIEDLARRDFVINAIAFDPVANVLVDPMGGMADIDSRIIRAVGDAERRFTEDGLRIMRAVRFVATLGFELEAGTEAAIPTCLPSLAMVSRERVWTELGKLLTAPAPARAIDVAVRTGVMSSILPEVGRRERQRWTEVRTAIDRAEPELAVRCALLLMSDGGDDAAAEEAAQAADDAGRRLRWSNQDRKRIVRLVRHGPPHRWRGLDDAAMRRRLAAVERTGIPDLVAFLRALGQGALADRIGGIAASGAPLAIGELAITGSDLITELSASPGPHLGETLRALLDAVLDDPTRNQRDELLALGDTFLGHKNAD